MIYSSPHVFAQSTSHAIGHAIGHAIAHAVGEAMLENFDKCPDGARLTARSFD
jgi:hypothetical protein